MSHVPQPIRRFTIARAAAILASALISSSLIASTDLPAGLASTLLSPRLTYAQSGLVVDFNTRPTGPLSGQYPSGELDWGSGTWSVNAPFGPLATRSVSFSGPGVTSGTVQLLVPRALQRLQIYAEPNRPSTVTLACGGNPTRTVTVAGGQLLTYDTGWTVACGSLAVTATGAWTTSFDTLELGSAAGGPTATSTSAAATATPTRTPTASPPAGPAGLVVDFNARPTGPLSGQYPSGELDWGSGTWSVNAPFGPLSTRSVSFSAPGVTSGTVQLLVPRALQRLQIYAEPNRPSTVTLACGGNPTRTVTVAGGQLLTYDTGWTVACGSLAVTATGAWTTSFDTLELGSATGGPTATSTSAAATATPTRTPTATGIPATPTSTSVPATPTSTVAAATATPTASPTSVPATSTPTSGVAQPTLLTSYDVRGDGVRWNMVLYRPRQFLAGAVIADQVWGNQTVSNPGPYAGWDIFPNQNEGLMRVATRADWLDLQLSRPATVAIVWRWSPPIPNWLGSWTRGPDVVVNGSALPTYTRSFPAGQVILGAVHNPGTPNTNSDPRNTYWVLFGESSGTAPPAPPVPAGRQTPVPNQTCPSWVHDQYSVAGPDGQTYPSWHPQIDPIYWCYFRHDHGSDPSLMAAGFKPPYGYVSTAAGENEPHAGFKSYVFDDGGGRRWLLTHHFGTGSLNRACVRFHAMSAAVANRASGEVLADLHVMGDFGKSLVNTTDEPLTPPGCPNQAALADAAGSLGVRKMPVVSRQGIGYEPWLVDGRGTILGFNTAALTFNTPDGVLICADVTCGQGVPTGAFGTFRFFSYKDNFGVGGPNSGQFYTDPFGKALMSAGQPGAVRQYIKPGVSIALPRIEDGDHCDAVDNWRVMYVCSLPNNSIRQLPINLEGALQPPN